MYDRYQALDHAELRARQDTLTAASGDRLRGHEFHYSTTDAPTDAMSVSGVERGKGIDDGRDGLTEHNVLGTYCRVHPESGAFDTFVERI